MRIRRLRSTAVLTAVLLCFGLSPKNVPDAHAVEFAPQSLNICFGSGFSFGLFGGVVNADNAGAVEFLVPARNDLVKLDGDFNTLAEGTLIRKLRLVNTSGADVWSSPASMVLGVDEVLSSFSQTTNPAVFMDLANPRLFNFYPNSTLCEGYGVAVAGGQRYIVAALGISAASGNESSGTDFSVVKVYVFNVATGAEVRSHKFAAQGGNYLLVDESGISDIDGDGSDEVFTVRTINLGKSGNKERFKIIVESFNLLTGASENRFVVFKNDEFLNQNPLP